jgi:FKBP-type peptidyl-prolyl cis-trans isomerase SlyD
MQISKNKVVSVSYTLRIEGPEGEIIEKVENAQPLTYIHGLGNMLESFEENLAGKTVGSAFTFMIPAEKAYGEISEEAVVQLPRNLFTEGEKEDPELLSIGNYVPMQDNDGNLLDAMVVEVNDDMVTLDFNHQLAGEDLFFDGEVTEIREATEKELSCGHIHEEGHHHHHHGDHDCGNCNHSH